MGKRHTSLRLDETLLNKIPRDENKSKLINILLKNHIYNLKKSDNETGEFLKSLEEKIIGTGDNFKSLNDELGEIKKQINNFGSELLGVREDIQNVINNSGADKEFFEKVLKEINRKIVTELSKKNKSFSEILEDIFTLNNVIKGAVILIIIIVILFVLHLI